MMYSILVDIFFGQFEQDSDDGIARLIGKNLGDWIFSRDDGRRPGDELMNGKVCDLEVLDEFDDIAFVFFDIAVILVVTLSEFLELIFKERVFGVIWEIREVVARDEKGMVESGGYVDVRDEDLFESGWLSV